VATTIEDLDCLEAAYRDAGEPPLAVGFVLRYAPLYKKINELVKSGSLGQILCIDAAELMGAPLTSTYMRGWRRHTALSGPLILEKCSHDLDILNWLVDSPAISVFSHAERSRFVTRPDAAMHCRDCNVRTGCRYDAEKLETYLMNVARREEIKEIIPSSNDLCVFNSDKDIWDHQTAIIRYQNGVLASFTVCTDQPRTTRTIRILGTEGSLVADLAMNHLELLRSDGSSGKGGRAEVFPILHDESGHHGGDSAISTQFKEMLRGKDCPPLAGLAEGVSAARLALAIEKSALTGAAVRIV
jgi:predicted dehydrogenase